MGKLVIFSAPSGSGKTTIVRELLKRFDCFEFSISATSRQPRGQEQNGVDYYFMTNEEFKARVERDEFVEWEEVYAGTCYGTLKSEMERIWNAGKVIIFDVDVMGDACSMFIMPPSIEELERRLRGRGTDAEEVILKRIAKAEFEISKADQFDHCVINDNLSVAVDEATAIINEFLK